MTWGSTSSGTTIGDWCSDEQFKSMLEIAWGLALTQAEATFIADIEDQYSRHGVSAALTEYHWSWLSRIVGLDVGAAS